VFAYDSSTIPISFDAGVVVGPWRGAYLELFGGYAKAENWLMPSYVNMTNFYTSTDIKGWHGGVKAGYNYRDIVDFSIRYETASQDLNRGYYLWRDRAKSVLNLTLQVTPIQPLDVVVGYELRKDRYCNVSDLELCEMGDAENLSIGANYQLEDRLSLFGQIENLLNSEYLLPGNVPAQGINALVGVNYKF
jgi:outer membrane receptor protein involved in Fe transport